MRILGLFSCILILSAGQAAAQTLTPLSDMAFGTIEMAGTPLSGDISMGTNGVISYPANASGAGTGLAAQVQINGTVGSVVNIRCTTSAILSGGGGNNKLTLGPVKVSVGTPQSYAAATSCNALNRTVLSVTLNANTSQNIVYMGGLLQTNGKSPSPAVFSTLTGSGAAPVTLRVIYN